MSKTKIALACQGGGSHTAFTAGVLAELTENWPDGYELTALSGTSGGAICAALTWAAALENQLDQAGQRLRAFWQDNSANTPAEKWVNSALVWGAGLKGVVPTQEVSPYSMPAWGENQFRDLLQKHFDFTKLNRLKNKRSPVLQIGAVEVLEGEFTVFDSSKRLLQLEMLLASAAIPNLFRAVQIGDHHYWDGLFSHNPPLLSLVPCGVEEIWVIQVNPTRAVKVPETIDQIEDRRNELAGNLSLEQEITSIRTINTLLRSGQLCGDSCHLVEVRRIQLECDLNYASKLDRCPEFIEGLIQEGKDRATDFLSELKVVAATD